MATTGLAARRPELFYRPTGNRLQRVDHGGAVVSVRPPETLLRRFANAPPRSRTYDVTRDGRFSTDRIGRRDEATAFPDLRQPQLVWSRAKVPVR
jgi:hypothetical protein